MSLYPKKALYYQALVGIPRGPKSQVYVVDPANGSDGNTGTTFEQPLATLPAAYAKCVANQHDVVLYVAGSASISLAAQLVWAKNYTHLIGLCAPSRLAQRARIFQTAGDLNLSPLINITATGCIFRDLYIFQGTDDAQSLVDVQVTGGRNVFENVHFAGGGHATNAITGCASLKLDGAEENLFRRCTFGLDTIAAGTGLVNLLFDSEAHRNVFEDCLFSLWAGNAGAAWVKVADATGIDRFNTFDRCTFLNTSATGLTSGFVIPAGMGAPRRLFLRDCMAYGAAKWDASDRGVLFGNMNAVTAADLSGVAVEMIT